MKLEEGIPKIPMRITLDQKANAAYIYLTSEPQQEPLRSYPCDPVEVGGMINLDFDPTGRLVGIEVLDAKQRLPKELLRQAEIIG